jgi:hypothetical protein
MVKIFKFLDVDPGWKNSDPGSGMEKSWIRDKHPGSATLNLPANRTAWWEEGEDECRKIVSKLLEIRSGLFIPDPDLGRGG